MIETIAIRLYVIGVVCSFVYLVSKVIDMNWHKSKDKTRENVVYIITFLLMGVLIWPVTYIAGLVVQSIQNFIKYHKGRKVFKRAHDILFNTKIEAANPSWATDYDFNKATKELKEFEDELGIKHSGRYPWGEGDSQN